MVLNLEKSILPSKQGSDLSSPSEGMRFLGR